MALSSSSLSAAIKAGLLANEDSQAVDSDALTALCDEIAIAVVAAITSTAVIGPGSFNAPAAPGPVEGIGTIT